MCRELLDVPRPKRRTGYRRHRASFGVVQIRNISDSATRRRCSIGDSPVETPVRAKEVDPFIERVPPRRTGQVVARLTLIDMTLTRRVQ